MGQNVPVEAAQGIGALAVFKQPVAADAQVQHRGGVFAFSANESLGEKVRPARIGVDGALSSIGQAVTQAGNRLSLIGWLDFQRSQNRVCRDLFYRWE